ncbi:LysR substrate-binding domain-containing protein [Streptomyces sp. NBC_01669]|uniref:LysR substrate-binding domain-containing protein n=1 Tax=Streptomyces sp. NBC_01669 TaxID=2975909 RepID=UPI002256BF90|nr:LysR substrate-binding domain-containing protein [Streptomyces sp. NBC_01669]MCX4538235.1 LysR substrate-binding domain-containing protein [Streptomyces sp. NBC_01669]
MKTPDLLDGRLKFRHLLLVDAIIRRGTLVAAADELHITQPAATRTLRELEELLGVPLFDRHPRGLSPTPFSEAFAAHARAVVSQVRQAGKHMAQLRNAEHGTVAIGIHLTGSNALVPRAVAMLKSRHPLLTVQLYEALPLRLLSELESGRLDLVVGRLTQPTDEHFIRRRLHDEGVSLVVRKEHPLAGRETIDPAELSAYPWILPDAEARLRGELEQFFSTRGIEMPANRVETTSYLAVRHLVLTTDSIAALSNSIHEGLPDVVRLGPSLELASHSVGITLAASRGLTPAASAMVAILHELADG